MPPDRLTIRFTPDLAAKLAARGGPHGNLAAIVRHAIEAYLAEEHPPRQPGQSPMADMTTTAATVADISTRLAALELRIAALEATAASGSQRQSARQPPRQPPAARARPPSDVDVAYQRMRVLQGQGCSLTEIAAQLDREGFRTKQGRAWHKSTVSYVLRTHGR